VESFQLSLKQLLSKEPVPEFGTGVPDSARDSAAGLSPPPQRRKPSGFQLLSEDLFRGEGRNFIYSSRASQSSRRNSGNTFGINVSDALLLLLLLLERSNYGVWIVCGISAVLES